MEKTDFAGASTSVALLKIAKDSKDLISTMFGLSLGVTDQQLLISSFMFAGQQLSIRGRAPSAKTFLSNSLDEVM
eukprot:CAMPEP_0196212964 /NCGR_PEP_ID=MMETSP0912-20130531/23183_1 /TAXON_ID=49265 /ORGANISM="Thalassiosira rotula, Strain GSO102" /LENGTH=74 /DNA_ID=CAMNT_0041489089 /DNA_START=122 /DNA_END=346 /DNA_ORIENTATION=+